MYVYVWKKNYTGTDTHTPTHPHTHTHIHLREGYSLLSVCRSHKPKTTPCTFLRRRVRGTAHGAHPQEGSLFQMQIMPEEASWSPKAERCPYHVRPPTVAALNLSSLGGAGPRAGIIP